MMLAAHIFHKEKHLLLAQYGFHITIDIENKVA